VVAVGWFTRKEFPVTNLRKRMLEELQSRNDRSSKKHDSPLI
jgi:hypothetical protein